MKYRLHSQQNHKIWLQSFFHYKNLLASDGKMDDEKENDVRRKVYCWCWGERFTWQCNFSKFESQCKEWLTTLFTMETNVYSLLYMCLTAKKGKLSLFWNSFGFRKWQFINSLVVEEHLYNSRKVAIYILTHRLVYSTDYIFNCNYLYFHYTVGFV